jgi:hypothetical protein
MVRQVESRALEGLKQLTRLRDLPAGERDRVLSGALVDVLLSRSSFGTARLWTKAGGVALVNPALLRLVAAEAKAASQSLSLQTLEVNTTSMR